MMNKKLFLLALPMIAVSMQSCATNSPGKMVPANSLQQKQMLESQRGKGFVIVGPTRNKPAVKEFLLTRKPDESTMIEVDGSRMIPKTVQVDFGYNSTVYNPTGQQRVDIRQLSVVADRVLVSANNQSRACTETDRLMAQERARVTKIALIEGGVEPDIITTSHDCSDRYVKGGSKRYVDINFIVDKF